MLHTFKNVQHTWDAVAPDQLHSLCGLDISGWRSATTSHIVSQFLDGLIYKVEPLLNSWDSSYFSHFLTETLRSLSSHFISSLHFSPLPWSQSLSLRPVSTGTPVGVKRGFWQSECTKTCKNKWPIYIYMCLNMCKDVCGVYFDSSKFMPLLSSCTFNA